MFLSIISPMYNEEKVIDSYFRELIPVLNKTNMEYEIICINDGSKDNTLKLLKQKKSEIPELRIFNFSRNFGKEPALSAGLDASKGDLVIPIDADLQDPPEIILELLSKQEEGYDVVLAKRADRSTDTFLKRFTANSFYKIIGYISKSSIPYNVGDFRVMTRKVVDVINSLDETQRFMKGIFSWPGFKTATVEYERAERVAGNSQFNGLSLWNLAVEGITSFSIAPLKISSFLGIIVSSLSIIYAGYIFFRTIFFGIDLPGYASLLVSILFIGGVHLISLGILGEYIGRIYMEVKKRPLYVIENEY